MSEIKIREALLLKRVKERLGEQTPTDVPSPKETLDPIVETTSVLGNKPTFRLPFQGKAPAKTREAFIFTTNSGEGIHIEKVDIDKIPKGCQPYYVEWTGHWMPLLVEREYQDGTIYYEAFAPKDNIEQLPEKLLRAIKMPAHRAMWAMTRNPLEKLAIGSIVVVLVAGMLLMFALATQKPRDEFAMLMNVIGGIL